MQNDNIKMSIFCVIHACLMQSRIFDWSRLEGGGCCCLYVVEKYKCDSYLKTDLINVYLKNIKIHFCYKIGKFGWKYLPAIGAGAQKLRLFMFLRQKRKLINSRVVSIGVAGEKFLNFNQSGAFQGQFFIHRVWEEFPEIPTAPPATRLGWMDLRSIQIQI